MSLKTRVLRLFGAGKAKPKKRRAPTPKAVSYTHLTLPTIYSV